MTKPIVVSLAKEWNIPTHFDPCKDYGKMQSPSQYITFGFKCRCCEAPFRADYRSVGQFEASVEAFVTFAKGHTHAA